MTSTSNASHPFHAAPRAALRLVVLSCLVTCASRVGADDGGITNVGGAARLMRDQGRIRMVSEVVRARVSQKDIDVDCVFVMQNDGPADTVLIGFPDRSSGALTGAGPMRTFRSWVDGIEVKCDTLPDADRSGAFGIDEDWDYWWTKRVGFTAGATRIIRDHYTAAPGFSIDGSQSFEYILETGASWAGAIGSAEITVTLVDIPPKWIQPDESPFRRHATPKPRVRGRELHWFFRDFEPGSQDGSPARIKLNWWSPAARKAWEGP